MTARRTIALALLALFLGACSLTANQALPTDTPQPPATATELPNDVDQDLQDMGVLPTEPSGETPVPTSTPEPQPTSATPWAGWDEPIYQDPSTPVPYPKQSIVLPRNVNTYLLMGSDNMAHRDSINTDAFMIVVVNGNLTPAKATVLSVPRDLYVFIPGFGMGRINSAYAHGGGEMAAKTVEYNFGLPVDHYLYLEMSEFRDFINDLGGVDVEISANVYDKCADGTVLNYLEGHMMHMNGRVALCYARARLGSNDFDRMRRQQDVVRAVLKESLERFGENPLEMVRRIYDGYSNAVDTDMSLVDFVDAGWLAAAVEPDESLNMVRLAPPEVESWTKPSSGAYLLVPQVDLRQWLTDAIGVNP